MIKFTKEEKQLMKRGGVVYNKNGYDYCLSNKRLMKRINNEDSIWEVQNNDIKWGVRLFEAFAGNSIVVNVLVEMFKEMIPWQKKN